jgi:hypothetical protein
MSAAIVILVVVLLVWLLCKIIGSNVQCVPDSAGEKTCIQGGLDKSKDAVIIIQKIKETNEILIAHLVSKYHYPCQNDKMCPGIARLLQRYKPDNIIEVDPNNLLGFTSYIQNHGQKYGLCIRQKKEGHPFVPFNEIMFVNLHELAHLCSECTDHSGEFVFFFKKLVENATQIRIYEPIDYSKQKKDYCGLKITENPIF